MKETSANSNLLEHVDEHHEEFDHHSHISSELHYKEYKYRFVIVVLYSLSSMFNAFMWITCSPINKALEKSYNLSQVEITAASLIYMVVYLPVNFPSDYFLDDWGLRVGILIGTITTVIGGWLRVLIKESFYWVLAGQLFAAIGQPFILNAPAKVAAYWFKAEHRTIATTVLSVVNPLGVGIGFLLPQIYVDSDASGDAGKDQIYNLMLFQAILGTVMCAPIIFYKDKPPTPPSYAAEARKLRFTKALKILFKRKDFILLLILFSAIMGNYCCLATVISPLMKPFGYDDDFSGTLGAILIVCGIVGSGVFGFYVENTHLYKFSLIICMIAFLASTFMAAFVMYSGYSVLICISIALMGFFTTPVLPISFELGCEMTFPVGEALSTGVLMSGGQIVGVIMVIIYDLWIVNDDQSSSLYTFIGVMIIGVIGLISIVFVVEKLRRSNQEHKHNSLISRITSKRQSHIEQIEEEPDAIADE